MICLLCKCPYCGTITGLDKDNRSVVFNPGGASQSACPHLVYAAWSISQWELAANGSSHLAWNASGDWRNPQLIAAIDEHPSDYLDGELLDLATTGINERLNVVCPHEVMRGQRTIERPLTAEERARELPGRDRETVEDFEAKAQCVFALDVGRFVNKLASLLVPELHYSS